jgi:DNA-binding CsgD family transcriptional regulator
MSTRLPPRRASIVVVMRLLTDRQREVIKARLQGRTIRDIAADTGVSFQAVQNAERNGLDRIGMKESIDKAVLRETRAEQCRLYREGFDVSDLPHLSSKYDDEIAPKFGKQIERDALEKKLEAMLKQGVKNWAEYHSIQKELERLS